MRGVCICPHLLTSASTFPSLVISFINMETRLSLKYSGVSVDSGCMDVYQASANMIAFSEFMVIAAKISYGEKIVVSAEVAGFGRGSFFTDLIFNFTSHAVPLFSSVSPSELLGTINQSFELWKHLQGKPPQATKQENHQTIKVTNNDGQIIQVTTETFNLVMNEKASAAVTQFVKKPLANEGVDTLEIGCEQVPIANVNKKEANYFDYVNPSDSITDNTMQMTLVIEAPVFKDGNKWRFSDGQKPFYADILDNKFLASVDRGEQFGKGDLLRVDLQIIQKSTGTKIKTEYFIEKVHEHKKVYKPDQNDLAF